jgi:RNA polymerase sigma-70 factor, ECF subfamily
MTEKEKTYYIENNYGAIGLITKKYLYSCKMEYDDLFQELVINLWQNVDKFDKTISKISTFIYNISKNYCLNKIKKLKRNKNDIIKTILISEIDIDKLSKENICDNNFSFIDNYNRDDLTFILNYIKNESSTLFKDFYFNNLTQKDLVKKYNFSQANISQKIKNEIKKYKKIFNKRLGNNNGK